MTIITSKDSSNIGLLQTIVVIFVIDTSNYIVLCNDINYIIE